MTHQQHDETKDAVLLLQQALTDALRSNRGGIECLQANNLARALKLFTIAFSKHERVKSRLYADVVRRRDAAGSSNGIRNRNDNTIIAGMDDWFVREQLYTPSGNGEGNSTDDLMHREPIGLPLEIESIVSSIVTKCYDTDEDLSEESLSNAMDLLTTCHAFNLGLVNHLYGIEVLRSGDGGISSRPDHSASNHHVNNNNTPGSVSEVSTAIQYTNPNAKVFFDRGGRFYEFTLRMERSRSKDENKRHRNTQSKIPRLIVVLGCLNNLADLYHKCKQAVRCKHCFKQLKTTTERLQGLLLPGQQPLRQEDERILRSYLPVFLNKSRDGLMRLRRSTTSSDDETSSDGDSVDSPSSRASSPTQQPHYAFNSFSAGAA